MRFVSTRSCCCLLNSLSSPDSAKRINLSAAPARRKHRRSLSAITRSTVSTCKLAAVHATSIQVTSRLSVCSNTVADFWSLHSSRHHAQRPQAPYHEVYPQSLHLQKLLQQSYEAQLSAVALMLQAMSASGPAGAHTPPQRYDANSASTALCGMPQLQFCPKFQGAHMRWRHNWISNRILPDTERGGHYCH